MESEIMALPGMFLVVAIIYLIHLFRKKTGYLSRNFHKTSQHKALKNEINCLHKMLKQISKERFDLYEKSDIYDLESICYLNSRIQNIFFKKIKLIKNYAAISEQEIHALENDALNHKKIAINHELNMENDKIIASLDRDIIQLQARRTLQWNSSEESRNYLVEQELLRNNYINSMYKRYRVLLEKIYVNFEKDITISRLSVDLFKPSAHVDLKQTGIEKNHRITVKNFEKIINKNTHFNDNYYVEHA